MYQNVSKTLTVPDMDFSFLPNKRGPLNLEKWHISLFRNIKDGHFTLHTKLRLRV